MNVREVGRKAGVPPPPALRVVALQIGDIFHGAAETRGADHRAIGASQASPRNVVPARVLVVAVEQFSDAAGVHTPAHFSSSLGEDLLSGFAFFLQYRSMRKVGQYLDASLGACFNYEIVAPGFQNLGYHQIEPESHLGAGVHGNTEARS